MASMSCKEFKCKEKRVQVFKLSFSELTTQLQQCELCENGYFKESSVAAKTYNIVASLWAEWHQKQMSLLSH